MITIPARRRQHLAAVLWTAATLAMFTLAALADLQGWFVS